MRLTEIMKVLKNAAIYHADNQMWLHKSV
jgi:hypothetical protein